jgi:hypothetical protein
MAQDEEQPSSMERKWSPDPASRCQRVEPYFDPERGWAKPNGTIGCHIPEHGQWAVRR